MARRMTSRVGSDLFLMNGLAIRSCSVDRRCGFTLIELLVVVAVIGILVSILMASVGGIKAKALDKQVESEVKCLAMAVRAYHTEIGDWPVPSAKADSGGVWSTNNYQVFSMLVKANNGRRNYLDLTNASLVSASATLRDPYKNKVSYAVIVDVTNNSVEVKSAGKDCIFGNGDDVSAIY